MKTAYKILVGKPERKKLFGICRRRWNDNIKLDSKETRLQVVYWIHLAKDRVQWRALVDTIMNIRVP